MTPTDRRQLNAQQAVVAIAESDDSAEVRWKELHRLKCFAEYHMRTAMTGAGGEKDMPDFEVRSVTLEAYWAEVSGE